MTTRTFTKTNILALVNAIVLVPLIRWAITPTIDMAGIGAYIAGAAVLIAPLIGFLEAGQRRRAQGSEQPHGQ